VKCICNFKYARYRRGGPVIGDVRGWLKYVQFRDDRNDHIPHDGGPGRWVDGGLGVCYQHILTRLDELSRGNRYVYCHHVVVSPDPQAMAAWRERQDIEGDPKDRFVEAVRDILQEWDEWRWEHDSRPQAGPIEYSFVVHRPVRAYGEQMHAHVVLGAATEHHMTRDLTPLYNDREHLAAFKEIACRQLDLAFGLGEEQRGAGVGQDPRLDPLLSDPEGKTWAEWHCALARLVLALDGEPRLGPEPTFRLLETTADVPEGTPS
jgi:hypothetical protein